MLAETGLMDGDATDVQAVSHSKHQTEVMRPPTIPVLLEWASDIQQLLQKEIPDIWSVSVLEVQQSTECGISEDTVVHTYLHAPLHSLFVEIPGLGEYGVGGYQGRDQLFLPDFTVFKDVFGHKYDLFIVEAKRPGSPVSDLFKMGRMMKAMLNELVLLGASQSTVLTNFNTTKNIGLIATGFVCTSYRMDMKAKHVYRMVELCAFRLPNSQYELVCLPLVMQGLEQVKNTIMSVAEKIEECVDARRNKARLTNRIPLSWTVENSSGYVRVKKAADTQPKAAGPNKQKASKNKQPDVVTKRTK
ncbi:hypothetical protein BJV82DRAFT_675707 [Fennellomyces sp. T-0311]|nr:hypothetical protein BJV82DRAFT_675707 [Fennellomyces sp. T-0311]